MNINGVQKKILITSSVIVLVMMLFPPHYGGYSWIFSPPRHAIGGPPGSTGPDSIDTEILLIQWVCVILVTGFLLLAFKGKTKK